MKPIAWRHMTFWGAVCGFLAGGAFMLILLLTNFVSDSISSAGLSAVLASAHVGAVLGIILGMITGFLVDFSLPIETSKFDKEQYQRQIWITLPLIIIVTALISKPMMDTTISLLNDFMYADLLNFFSNTSWITFFPAGMASLLAGYAANRYLLRLRKYAQPPRKSHDIVRKIKREDRSEAMIADDDYGQYQVQQQRKSRYE